MIRSGFHSSTPQLCPMGMYACWLHPKLCCIPHKQLILAFGVSKSRLQRKSQKMKFDCVVSPTPIKWKMLNFPGVVSVFPGHSAPHMPPDAKYE